MNIFICEENEEQIKKTINIINKVLNQKKIEGNIKLATSSPDKLLDYINTNKTSGVYFIDIELGKSTSGIFLAKKINEIDKNALITIVTASPDKMELVFKNHISAVDYIVKDHIEGIHKRIEKCLEFIDNKLRQIEESKCLIVENNESIEKVKYEDIIYCETVKKRTIALHTHKKTIEFKGTLRDIENKLDERFIRCHKSYIANKEKILSINKKDRILFMENGSKCFVSTLLINKIISKIS
ncbi:LytR/AlgR family response regulator transcription factor [Romboutsia lituseburensis]|uniref:LytR/AlgR family response regulator transcription factor n=1 Tax=Romboutsia lituseburensis TaxID=1537 RepID=UPI00215A6511|nr:LytTR family DNA-binding domain-containing protein [Romboutsia lituseburensis]MCR8745721.1 LytTR family DNA-binding domain-containing protein [Romboutsia lituseburensis]